VTLDVAAAVAVVANWSMPSIPRAIGEDQSRQLLASIDRCTATGRRDCAILLLLARLGLRSSEVAFLELDDIDWDAGQVSVRGKRGHRTALPLPKELPTAMATPPLLGGAAADRGRMSAFRESLSLRRPRLPSLVVRGRVQCP